MILALLPLLAHAELPLPSWREERIRAEWAAVNARIEAACSPPKFIGQPVVCDVPNVRAAIARATAFQEVVAEDGGLEYLIGLGHRYLGEDDVAEAHYERAVKLSPDDQGAWYDLGELYMASNRLDQAQGAFTRVSELTAASPSAWVGPWRLAEVAAARHDPVAFEAQMREALRRGFSFRTIAGLPNWKAYYADPALRDSIEKLVTVYGDPRILDSLR